MELHEKHCIPCEGKAVPLQEEAVRNYLNKLTKKWEIVEHKKIRHEFIWKDFIEAIEFVNNVAELAEQEDHHPDIHISYKKVIIELWTHAIGGLSENDFILASKIEKLP